VPPRKSETSEMVKIWRKPVPDLLRHGGSLYPAGLPRQTPPRRPGRQPAFAVERPLEVITKEDTK
jgi:hypothetical protein